MQHPILKPSFFNRPASEAALDLIGKILVRKSVDFYFALIITEVEAYDGFDDKASHAHKGETDRNRIMYGAPGYFYVYLCYGMYWMLNIVTGPKKYPAAILIRGVGETAGPGRLTRKINIDKTFDGLKASKKTGLWFEDHNISIPKKNILKTPRIGINYAGPVWSKKPLRFVLKSPLMSV